MERRTFLKRVGVASAALAGTPSLLSILESCGGGTAAQPGSSATPNFAKGGEVHLLQWQSFVPEADKKFQELMTRWASQHKGWSAVLDTVNGNDLQTKTSAAVESQSGPDIIQMQYNWPWLYANACTDMSAAVERVVKKNGKFFPFMQANCKVKGTWRAVPFSVNPNAWVYRKDLWSQVGQTTFPSTYADLTSTAKALAAKTGIPVGQALGHAYGDATTLWYPLLWSFGGQEVEKDGKTVALDSQATRNAVQWLVDIWQSGGWDRTTLSWDDSSNNRAYAAKKLAATLNGASIYISTLPGHNAADPFLQQNTGAGLPPRGPKAQASLQLSLEHAVMRWSPNPGAALDLVEYLMQKDVYREWMTAANGYNSYPSTLMDNSPVWNDPVLKTFNQGIRFARWPGWPGPPSKASSKVQTSFYITDMFAKAVQNPGNVKQLVSATAQQLTSVYGQPS